MKQECCVLSKGYFPRGLWSESVRGDCSLLINVWSLGLGCEGLTPSQRRPGVSSKCLGRTWPVAAGDKGWGAERVGSP